MIIISIIIIDLFALYYLKYKNQGISIREFNLFNTGNLLNLIFSLILIISLIIYTKSFKGPYRTGIFLTCTVLMTGMLIISEIYSRVRLPLPDIYLLDHPFKDILKGLFFSLYQFTEFVFISIIWLTLSGRKDLLILRSLVNSLIIVIFLLVFAFIYLQSGKDNNLRTNQSKREKYIGIVLGAAVWPNNQPSPSLASRAEKAAELFEQGVLSRIQLTGGHAPGEMSESEVAYHYLKNRNIDTSKIWIEKKTASTIEQIKFIKRDIIGIKNIKDILIISDDYHLKRVNEICKFYGIKVKVAASDLKLSFDSNVYHKLRESIALLVFWFFAI